jgi:hypothetical protein
MDSDEEMLWHVQRDLEALGWPEEDASLEDNLFDDGGYNADEESPSFWDEDAVPSDSSRSVIKPARG